MDELVYDNFAYKHSVIGSMADLDAASVEDVQQFFKTYYAPNNAVLALAGDLDTKDTLAKVKKYFGTIPRQPAPKPVDLTRTEEVSRSAGAEDRRQAGASGAAGYRLSHSRDAPAPKRGRWRSGRIAGRRRKLAAVPEAGEGQGGRCFGVRRCQRARRSVEIPDQPPWCGQERLRKRWKA